MGPRIAQQFFSARLKRLTIVDGSDGCSDFHAFVDVPLVQSCKFQHTSPDDFAVYSLWQGMVIFC